MCRICTCRFYEVSVCPAVGVDSCEDAAALTHLVQAGAALFDVDGRDDWKVLADLRQRFSSELPIVVLSGWLTADRRFQDRARDLGCAGFVASPPLRIWSFGPTSGAAAGVRRRDVERRRTVGT
jgi:hypothetical protein